MGEDQLDPLTRDATNSRSTGDYEPPVLTVMGSLHQLTQQVCDPNDPTCASGGIP